MRKYKIGQLSKMMGVSSHLLKHYEKFDLVYPTKDDTTNYRYYDISQCSRIIESKQYRNIGFPLKDTARIINELSADQIDQLIEQQIAGLGQEITLLEYQKELAEKYYKESCECKRKLNQWFVEELKGFYILTQTTNNELLDKEGLPDIEGNILEVVPLAKQVLHIEAETFMENTFSYQWGIGISDEDLKFLEGKKKVCIDGMTYVPPQRVFVTYIKVKAPYMDNHRLFDQIAENYQEFDNMIQNEAYAVMVKAEREEGELFHYYSVFIPLEKVDSKAQLY